MADQDVLIVGAGLAGLCCARKLHQAGINSVILEASDDIGGRARTDLVNGFLCDRGFQVFLTAYPEAKQVLNYQDLKLQTFEPGSLVRYRNKFVRFSDPWRRPQHAIATAFSPIASFSDKWRVAILKREVSRGSLDELYEKAEETTLARLSRFGFSKRIIEHFFKPFMGGVFLENELSTSSRMFDFVFRMFANGDATLPAGGMGEMARQISQQLPPNTIRTNTRVVELKPKQLRLASDEILHARDIVVACEASAAEKLPGLPTSEDRPTQERQVTCIYFTAPKPPFTEPILVLNADESGPINNLCVPSQIAPTYAPDDQALISVTTLNEGITPGSDILQNQVLQQARAWYGPQVDAWNHLKTYTIKNALPAQSPPSLSPVAKNPYLAEGLYVCGDYCNTASINGAMVSGRDAAVSLLRRRGIATA